MKKLKGIAASPGIAIGKAFIVKRDEEREVKKRTVPESEVEAELKRFNEAVSKSKEQLEKLMKKAAEEIGEKEAAIFEAHSLILEDPALIDEVVNKVRSERIDAASAIKEVAQNYALMLETMEDEYLRERAVDIKDVGDRVIGNLMGKEQVPLANLTEKVIVVAANLTPSDTAQMSKEMVLSFVTDLGGRTSHAAIMARSLRIPAVVGLCNVTREVGEADTIIVDGNRGEVVAKPDEETVNRYLKMKEDYEEYQRELEKIKDLPAETPDGRRVEIAANVGTPEEVEDAFSSGAEAIGLFRSEFSYMDRDTMPTEDELFKAYKKAAGKRAVIIRTLDVGGDKPLGYLDMPTEMNPFLGWRGIRMFLDEVELFKTQLRAILRASAYGNLKIMYPMVSTVEEVKRANKILGEVKEELREEGVSFNEEMEVGIMVEVPSAALTADVLAREVDFFSIGTNDLTQYTMATDRGNERIAKLFNPLHPAVLRLIKQVIDAAHQEGRWVGMCGEMAGDPMAIPVLLGMGLDEFSMSTVSIPKAKKIIRSMTHSDARKLTEEVLSLSTTEEIEERLKRFE